jgi:hypothetical protein
MAKGILSIKAQFLAKLEPKPSNSRDFWRIQKLIVATFGEYAKRKDELRT